MKVNLIRLLTFLFSLSCVSFVFYQGNNCWIKYKTIPQTTQVSIEKATRHPDITFCPTWDFYIINPQICVFVSCCISETTWPMIEKNCMRNVPIKCKISTEKIFRKSKKIEKIFTIFFPIFFSSKNFGFSFFSAKFYFRKYFFRFFNIPRWGASIASSSGGCRRAKRAARRRPRCRSRRVKIFSKFFFP